MEVWDKFARKLDLLTRIFTEHAANHVYPPITAIFALPVILVYGIPTKDHNNHQIQRYTGSDVDLQPIERNNAYPKP
jgi:hypothetical protein